MRVNDVTNPNTGLTMNSKKPSELEQLKQRLDEIRKASLAATNKGDYMKVARLTTQAATLNKAIIQMAGPIWG